jgi:hypothetical protein
MMKKFLFIILLVSVLAGYTISLGEDYTNTVNDLFDRWFDTPRGEERPGGTNPWENAGPVIDSFVDASGVRLVVGYYGESLEDDEYIRVGYNEYNGYELWEEGGVYASEPFYLECEEASANGARFTVSLIDLRGNASLLTVADLSIENMRTGVRVPIDEFEGTIFSNTESSTAPRYRLYAKMPDEVAEGLGGSLISGVSLKFSCDIPE